MVECEVGDKDGRGKTDGLQVEDEIIDNVAACSPLALLLAAHPLAITGTLLCHLTLHPSSTPNSEEQRVNDRPGC